MMSASSTRRRRRPLLLGLGQQSGLIDLAPPSNRDPTATALRHVGRRDVLIPLPARRLSEILPNDDTVQHHVEATRSADIARSWSGSSVAESGLG